MSFMSASPQDTTTAKPTSESLERSIRTAAKDASLVPISPTEVKVSKTITWPGQSTGPKTAAASEIVSFELGKVDGKAAYVDVALPREGNADAASEVATAIEQLKKLDVGGKEVQSCTSKPRCVKVCVVNGKEQCCRYGCSG
ncbi:MAG TPA: hypothetical protein VMZ66_04860 [Aeromicrobium sp.]|nr:hypothetical protein [Aeromicrobium sp.]